MGGEIGQFDEWNANTQLEWSLFDYEKHRQLNHFFAEVNKFYRDTPAMHENDYDWDGFQWIALDDYQNSVISFRRIAYDGSEIICICNFQPVTRENYKIGVPVYGVYEEVFNSENTEFGGCGIGNSGDIKALNEEDHNLDYCIDITLPPLGVLYIKLKEALPAPPKKVKKKTTAKKTTTKKAPAKKAPAKKTPPKKVRPKKPADLLEPKAEEAKEANTEE